MGVTIRFHGLEEVRRAFLDAERDIEGELEDAVDTVLGWAGRKLATYPPARPGSDYVRTGRLGRGWIQTDRMFTAGAGGVTGAKLTNPVKYAEFVQGIRQAWMHVGNWITVADVQREADPVASRALDRAASNVAKRLTRAGV